MDIKLGQKVTEITSGFTGTVDHIMYNLHDSVKIGIQAPLKKDGTYGECYTVDYICVKVLDKKPVVKGIESTPKYGLGDKAKCRITGFQGTIMAYILYLNGCVHYKIQPEIPSGKKAEDYSALKFPEGCLDVTPLKKKEVPQKTGGPKLNGKHKSLF
jgi:hypothetical protein